MLKNPRRERFAQLLAGGKTAKDAYEIAGYKPNRFNAAAMARNPEINARVTQINTAAAERAVITRQSLIEKAEAARAGAMEARQFSAAVAATKEIGVLSGIRIERSERGMPGEFDWLEKLTVDELRLLADGKLDIASYRQDDGPPRRSRPSLN